MADSWPRFDSCDYLSMQIAAADMHEFGVISMIEMLILQSISSDDCEVDEEKVSGFDLFDSVNPRINYISALSKIHTKALSGEVKDANYIVACDSLLKILQRLSGKDMDLTLKLLRLSRLRDVKWT